MMENKSNILSFFVSLSDANSAAAECQLGLLQLPHEILEKILTYLTFDEISLCRQTCKELNMLASSSLNIGFTKADRLHTVIQREVKAKLPRRESERRNHPLARHVDILSAIETRLSLLSMTYSKYIDLGLCCFIPGKVLDEIYCILKSVRVNPNPPRAHELLQELRDISSMAMEHFDEKIAPNLRSQMPETSELRLVLSAGGSSTGRNFGVSPYRFTANSTTSLTMSNSSIRRRQIDQLRKQLRQTRAEMRQRLGNRERKIAELSRKIAEQNHVLGELNRRIVEYDQRFDDVMAEVARVRAAEDQRLKQQCISSTDAPSTSSAGEVPLPKHGTILVESEGDRECKSLSVSGSSFDHSRSASSANTDSRKRKGSSEDRGSKRIRKTDDPTANEDTRCLRSGRQLIRK